MMTLKNKRLTDEEFYKEREEVLKGWPTGEKACIQEGINYQSQLPAHKNFAAALCNAKKKGKILIQPRAGVALVEEHIELLKYLQDNSEVDLLPTTIDAYTRQNRYEKCEEGIKASKETGSSMLNGFPAVNHGVDGVRQVVETLDLPLQVRHGTPDARLLAEITYTGGYTSYEGGGISYNIPYVKNVSLETTLRHWQYVDRLTGIYQEAGVTINREPFGPLTGTLVPPSMAIAIGVIEALLAAEQGVKSITVGYGQLGNLVQDVAAIRALQTITEDYLAKYGYEGVEVTTVIHQWMGGFPQDEAQAFSVIAGGSVVAALAGAAKVIVKTPHEAMGIPTMEANAQGLRATKQAINMFADQRLQSDAVEEEIAIIKAETNALLDKCFELGDGDIAVGTVKAFEAGVLDVPFAPSKFNAGKVLTARDNEGAVRYFDIGNLPFNEELIAFNKEKINERAKAEDREATFQMVIDDVYAISKGHLVGRPRD